jgi:hypothetical protein
MKRAIPVILFLSMTFLFVMNGQSLDGRQRHRRRIQPRPAASPTPVPPVINKVNEPHTFTVAVETEANGNQWRPVENAHVTITLTNSGGAVATPTGPFTGVTDADGHYSVTFNSATPGTITAHASAEWQGQIVATDGIPPNGSDAIKTYVHVEMRVTFLPSSIVRKK